MMLRTDDLFGEMYQKATRKGVSDKPKCCICGKTINDTSKVGFVHVVDGGGAIATEDEPIEENGDMGYFPVGNECRRQHPDWEPYIVGGRQKRGSRTQKSEALLKQERDAARNRATQARMTLTQFQEAQRIALRLAAKVGRAEDLSGLHGGEEALKEALDAANEVYRKATDEYLKVRSVPIDV